MRITLIAFLAVGLLGYALAPQWRSFDRMGERRLAALSQMPKEVLVGVCWPFSANHDGMADGLQLAQEEINAGGLARGVPVTTRRTVSPARTTPSLSWTVTPEM